MSAIVSYHPTYALLRNPYEHGSFRIDLDRFKRLIDNKLKSRPERLITNAKPEDIKRLIEERLPIAIDVETRPSNPDKPWTGKDPTQAKLKTIGLGNSKWGLSFCWGSRTPEHCKLLKHILSELTTVSQNGPGFDHIILRRYGFKIVSWEDTMHARRAISSTSKLSLAFLASIYDDTDPWKEAGSDDEKGLYDTSDLEELMKYNAQDCVETARSWDGIIAEHEWNDPWVQNLYKIHKETAVIAASMRKLGFRIDLKGRKRISKELLKIFLARKKAYLDYVNIPGFKCNANDLRKLLFKRHETDKIKRFSLDDPYEKKLYTPTGLIKVDLNSLILLVTDPVIATEEIKKTIDLYWLAASAWKARSTYVKSKKVSQAIGLDKRLRSSWNSCGTDTGRWSSKDPNVQNLAAKDRNDKIRGRLPDVRRMYVSEPSRILVHFDHSQLEIRVRAAVMQDDVLEADLNFGDVYALNAQDWFGITQEFFLKTYNLQTPKVWNLKYFEETYGKESDIFKRVKAIRFNCKTGHLACIPTGTKVATLTGSKNVEDLTSKDTTWSWDGEKYALSKIVKTTYQGIKKCVRIVMRDGANNIKHLTITGDHRILLRDGTYKRADELVKNDRLMPFRRYTTKCGYREIDPFNNRSRYYEHKWILPNYEVVHHKNENKGDNRLENLEGLSDHEHRIKHGAPKVSMQGRLKTAKASKDRWSKNKDEMVAKLLNARLKSKAWKAWCASDEMKQHLKKIANHKVVAIEHIDIELPVWDVEVNHPSHNFALDGLIFIHNSQYGAGLTKVHQNLLKEDRSIKISTTSRIHEGFAKRYHKTVKFWENEYERVLMKGFSETLILHRKRVYPAPPDRSDTANYPIQGTAADIITLELIDFNRFLPKIKHARMLTHEHDAITFEVLNKHVKPMLDMIEEVTSKTYEINGRLWQFPIETKVGRKWSDV